MRRLLKALFLLASLGAFAWITIRTFADFDWRLHLAHPGWLVLAVVFQLANAVSQFLVWNGLLAGQGVRDSLGELYRVYGVGSLARYLPVGKLAQVSAIVATTASSYRMVSLVSFLEWTLSGLLSGVIFMTLIGCFLDFRIFVALASACCMALALVFVPAWEKRPLPGFVLDFLERHGKIGWNGETFAFSRRRVLKASAGFLIFSWGAESLAALCLLANSRGTLSSADGLGVVFSNAVSYFGGLLAFFVPMGLGVREGLFYWISQRSLGAFEAGFIPVGMRATWFLAEIVFLVPLLAWVFQGRRRAGDARPEEMARHHRRLWTQADSYPGFTTEEYAEILRKCPLLRNPGKKVLDIGCGVGRVAAEMKKLGHRVDGIDLVEGSIATAVREGRIEKGFAVEAARTGLPDASYDVLVCFGVLLYVFELGEFLQEARRLIKPGGELLILDHNAANPYVKAHFCRPDWFDRLLEGRSNAPRRPLSRELVEGSDRSGFEWQAPEFLSLYTSHPNGLINAVHALARVAFGLVRRITRARWTGNMIVMIGRRPVAHGQIGPTSE